MPFVKLTSASLLPSRAAADAHSLLSERFHRSFRQIMSARIHSSSRQQSPSTYREECMSQEHAPGVNPLNHPTSFLALLSRCFGVHISMICGFGAIGELPESSPLTCGYLTELWRAEERIRKINYFTSHTVLWVFNEPLPLTGYKMCLHS